MDVLGLQERLCGPDIVLWVTRKPSGSLAFGVNKTQTFKQYLQESPNKITQQICLPLSSSLLLPPTANLSRPHSSPRQSAQLHSFIFSGPYLITLDSSLFSQILQRIQTLTSKYMQNLLLVIVRMFPCQHKLLSSLTV